MRRRDLPALIPAAGLAASAALAQDQRRGALEISDLEVFCVKVNARGNWLLVRVRTKDGVTGIGDASHGGPDRVKADLAKRLFELLKGRSASEVEAFRRAAAEELRKGGTPAVVAFSALEQAMWDIAGKALGVPCFDLFGGALSTRIRNYANINRSTEERSPEGFAVRARQAVEVGFDAIKLAPWDDMPPIGSEPARLDAVTALGLKRAQAVRDAIGPKRDLLLDGHSHFDLTRGLSLAKAVEPLNLFWLEEVVPARPVTNLAAINKAAAMPTAGGESIYGVRGFYPYIRAEAVDIVMPDVKDCGGMLELKKISALAEAAGIPVAPHGPASPVGNVAAAHVCASMSNFHILEFSFGEVPWRADLIQPAEVLDRGYLSLSRRPGLGIELNSRVLERERAPL